VLLQCDKVCNNKSVCALNKHQGQRGMQNCKEHIWKRHAACLTAYTRLAAKLWPAEQQKEQIQGCQKAKFLPHQPVQCLSVCLSSSLFTCYWISDNVSQTKGRSSLAIRQVRSSDGLREGRSGFDSRQEQNFSLLYIIQTNSGAHPASHPMGTANDFTGRSVKLATQLHLAPRSRMVYLHSSIMSLLHRA
jgi:hypothetical protein